MVVTWLVYRKLLQCIECIPVLRVCACNERVSTCIESMSTCVVLCQCCVQGQHTVVTLTDNERRRETSRGLRLPHTHTHTHTHCTYQQQQTSPLPSVADQVSLTHSVTHSVGPVDNQWRSKCYIQTRCHLRHTINQSINQPMWTDECTSSLQFSAKLWRRLHVSAPHPLSVVHSR